MIPISYQLQNLYSFIEILPRSIVLEIFKLLPRHELLSVSRVCRLSRAIAMDPSLFPLVEFRLFNALPSGTLAPTVIPFYKIYLGTTPETEIFAGKEPTQVVLESANSRHEITLGEIRACFIFTAREFVYVDVNYKCTHAKVEQDNATLTFNPLFLLFSIPEIQRLNLEPSKFYINFRRAKSFIYITFNPKINFSGKDNVNNREEKKRILIYEVDCHKPPSCFFENLRHHIICTELGSRVISIERIEQNSSSHLMIHEDLFYKEINENYVVLSQRETEENFRHFFYDLNTQKLQARTRISHLLPDLKVSGIYCLFHQALSKRKESYQKELYSQLRRMKKIHREAYVLNWSEENYDPPLGDPDDFVDDDGRVQEPEIYQPEIVAKTILANIRTLQVIPLTQKTKELLSTFDDIKDIQVLGLEEKGKMKITIEGKRNEEEITIESTVDITISMIH